MKWAPKRESLVSIVVNTEVLEENIFQSEVLGSNSTIWKIRNQWMLRQCMHRRLKKYPFTLLFVSLHKMRLCRCSVVADIQSKHKNGRVNSEKLISRVKINEYSELHIYSLGICLPVIYIYIRVSQNMTIRCKVYCATKEENYVDLY